MAIVGMTIKQLPDFAFRSAGDYAAAMDDIHGRYDPVMGTALVDVLERLSVFSIFRSVWFSAGLTLLVVSIVVCTLDRTPKLWRGVADIRVDQPEPYFDPRLPDRAAMTGVAAADARSVLRRNHFRVREATGEDGTTFLYGDRHQFTKMATLLTHTGLVLFLVAAAVTSRLGDEQGLVVPEGESLTVQPIGTPGLLLVKNLDFEAPGFETGQASDFTTDLAVYQNGQEIARKTIRVNDPLSIGGYTFHQNGFGPAPYLIVKDAAGRPLWDGAVPLTDAADGSPYGILAGPRPGHRPPAPAAQGGRRDDGRADAAVPGGRREPGRDADHPELRRHDPQSRRHPRVGPAGAVGPAAGRRGVHAAHRQARPGAGHHLARVHLADRRDHDHVLPAAPPRLDAADRGRTPGGRVALGPLRRRRAGVRPAARRPGGGPPAGGDAHPGRRLTPARSGTLTPMHKVATDGRVLNRNPTRCYRYDTTSSAASRDAEAPTGDP